MRIIAALVISTSLLSGAHLSAQELIKVYGGYELDGVFYHNEWDIIEIFDNVPEAKKAYLKSKSYNTKANTFGGISLASIGISFLLIKEGLSGSSGIDYPPFFIGYGFGLLACITGTTGLIYANKRGAQKRRALNVFNERALGSTYEHNRYEIGIGTSANGVGFFVAF